MSRQRNWAALLVSGVALLLALALGVAAGWLVGWLVAAGTDAALRLVAGVLSAHAEEVRSLAAGWLS